MGSRRNQSDPLAHQRRDHGGVGIPGRVVVELQQHRLALAATAHRPDPDMTRFTQGFASGDAGGHLVTAEAANEQQSGLRQAHGVDGFRAAVGHLAHPVGRFEQGGEFGRFLLALFTKIELANPLAA